MNTSNITYQDLLSAKAKVESLETQLFDAQLFLNKLEQKYIEENAQRKVGDEAIYLGVVGKVFVDEPFISNNGEILYLAHVEDKDTGYTINRKIVIR